MNSPSQQTSRPAPSMPTVRGMRLHAGLVASIALVIAVAWSGSPLSVRARAADSESSAAFREVGRVPLAPEGDDITVDDVRQSGWLILNHNEHFRRGYQLFESAAGKVVIQSFDLDTLAPIRRVVLPGVALIPAGTRAIAGPGGTSGSSGEVVYAIDEEAGRIYLPLSAVGLNAGFAMSAAQFFTHSPDTTRPIAEYLVIDERAFNAFEDNYAASFAEVNPAAWLRSLTVDRSHAAPGAPGQLLSVVTTAGTNVHQIRRWDVGGIVPNSSGPAAAGQSTTTVVPDPLPITLDACNGPMTSGDTGQGTYQWGMLLIPEEPPGQGINEDIVLGCHTGSSAQAVYVRIEGGAVKEQTAYQLSRPVADVLVDPVGKRLLFKSNDGGSQTWWVFDATARRFVGALAGMLSTSFQFGAGIDDTSGRLYMLVPNYVTVNSSGVTAVRGGLETADTRLSPVPAAENVAPELAYPGIWRLQVDVTERLGRRVFVRRGNYGAPKRYEYGSTTPGLDAPIEPYYLVLRDTRAVPVEEPENPEADRRFTTNVAEADGVTKASYQAAGSGYGARGLLVGGIGAATDRGTAGALTDCDKEDRELLVGQVDQAALSDVAASARAASLAADSVTEEQAGQLGSRCGGALAGVAPDPASLDFDKEGGGPDGKEPDGRSDYRTECVDDDNPRAQRPPDALPGSGAGFSADVDCSYTDETVKGEAHGGLGMPGVTVGYGQSKVDVERRPQGGVVVHVDSIARDIDLDLGGHTGHIGVVRAEATSQAAGRDGTARGTFVRKVCSVDIPEVFTAPHCLSEEEQANLEDAVRSRFSGQMEIRFRKVEPTLLQGSVSGYRAGVQRQAIDLFQDASITKDKSLAVPGMEIVFYRGDSPSEGPGRQILQLAGVQAGTSYGIACLYGQDNGGSCARSVAEATQDPPPAFEQPTVGPDGNLVAASPSGTAGGGGSRSLIQRIKDLVTAPIRLAADVLRLLFSNPREFGLMATVWALVYIPCYLGERRRTLARLAARRAVGAGAL